MKNYLPKVGDTFYWEEFDLETNTPGEIHEDICLKIEEENNPDLETMFFVSLSKNGGGCFVTESDILDPNSKKVQEFKKKIVDEKVKHVINYISQEEVRQILIKKLIKHAFTNNEATVSTFSRWRM